MLKDKSNCCGCGACVSICPKEALSLQKDKYGFLYPFKNNDLCIDCNLCEKVCRFDSGFTSDDISKDAYAVTSKDLEQSANSSSGGFFAKLAEYVIKSGGYVCGAAWNFEDNNVSVKHIIIDRVDDIKLLQGSKYIQSDIGDCYKNIQSLLIDGKYVFFSGTPCQVDGLKGFLRRDYNNLLLLDIVCHGVPNSDMFNGYLQYKWPKLLPSEISFRDKRMGWGMNGYMKGKKKTIYITPENSSYFSEFIKGAIYRENCYKCPYAGENRPADITIGDFWGVMQEHKEFAQNQSDAISAVILNSEKGISAFKKVKESLNYCQSDFAKISKHNSQLRQPTICPTSRSLLLDKYAEIGYKAIEDEFRSSNSKISVISESLKLFIKAYTRGRT
jgi:coenzyme F420-reducing hydrogenase beta subunit